MAEPLQEAPRSPGRADASDGRRRSGVQAAIRAARRLRRRRLRRCRVSLRRPTGQTSRRERRRFPARGSAPALWKAQAFSAGADDGRIDERTDAGARERADERHPRVEVCRGVRAVGVAARPGHRRKCSATADRGADSSAVEERVADWRRGRRGGGGGPAACARRPASSSSRVIPWSAQPAGKRAHVVRGERASRVMQRGRADVPELVAESFRCINDDFAAELRCPHSERHLRDVRSSR